MDKPSALVTFISTELLLVAGLVGLHFLGVSTFTIGIVGSVLFVILNITFALTRPRASLPSGETNWKSVLIWSALGLVVWVNLIIRLSKMRR